MPLLSVLVTIAVVFVLLLLWFWMVEILPAPERLKQALNIAGILIAIVYIAQRFLPLP